MEIPISAFQRSALAIPESYDLFLGGGRGGAKSWTLALLAWRHCEQYKAQARVLYLRQTYKGVVDFEQITRDLFGQVYGPAARFNAHEKVWRLPSGGYFEIGQLEHVADYAKYQGRSFTLILIDEAGQYPDAALLDRLRSNLRGPSDLPLRMALAANPGDVGHMWLANRYALRGTPWVPFLEEKSGRWWVSAPSTFRDNPFIDRDAYAQQLASSVPGDPELLEAWLSENWAIKRGAFFAGCLSDERNALPPWTTLPDPPQRRHREPGAWQYYLAHDFGSSAPSITFLCARSPGTMLVDAGSPDKPGLYISRRCEYFWATVPFLARDPRQPDDVDSRGPDHAADACRYACTYSPAGVHIARLPGA
jgi:terminase large subunit-like protein